MQSLDTHQQPFNGQQRNQHHLEDASSNSQMQMPSGNFLLPGDGQFTFSAEPDSMLNYGSLVNSNGQENAFTPNTNSSFDSSLHPEVISQTFPPANSQMQLHNYSLSPGSHGRNGVSLSPSHSAEHLSPEPGYMSDSSYNISNSYASPGFPGLLSDFSNQLNFTENPNTYQHYTGGPVDMSLLTGPSLATFDAQQHILPSNARLVSPSPTANSSPIVTDEMSRNAHVSGVQYMNNEYEPSSTPPNRLKHTQQFTPSKQQQYQQQQHSPALTNSPGNRSLSNQTARTHLASPIVRVENYGGRESPPSDSSRPVSKRSHGSRRSGNHLSPYLKDDSSDDGDDSHQPVRIQTVARSTERNEDGSWAVSQPGLNPDDRQALNDAWIPSLEEIADQRLKVEKKLEVHDWLSRSELGSEADDTNGSGNLLRPVTAGRRRAKSTNDVFRQGSSNGYGLGVHTGLDHVDDSNVPGPGIYINEGSEYYEDDEEEEEVEPESPPANVDIGASRTDNEVSAFPAFDDGVVSADVRPWVDAASQPAPSSTRYQPPASNAAMMRFRRRAKDVESASLAATVGSRRLSESDLGSVRGSIRGAPGVIKVIEPDLKKQKERQRRPSFLENILPKRAPANLLKRKPSIPVPQTVDPAIEKAKEAALEKPKRMGSWGRPKSPKVDTNIAAPVRDFGPPSSTGLSASNNKWYQGITRVRSKSELGIAELMTRHGGPPMPMLASPMADTEVTKPSPNPSPGGDDDDDDAQEAVTMDLAVRSDPIIPTYEGFKSHARQLNPRLTEYMVERITQEQMRRYKRLLEFRVKHLNAVKNRNCPSAKFCPDLGGESQPLPPRAGNKDVDAPFIGFQVTAPEASGDDNEPLPEGTVVPAQFPSGVPLPPVQRLPAEFECPLCFKVKQFFKPSDWTKHVHEDVQPFTCTFPNCGEPKSFKRKADWVRHENERHRQLEHWTCQIADCNHTCYRKDNFVQHLVREHKIAEPRQRSTKKDAASNPDPDDIWGLVSRCRGDTTKQPKDEPCRFCGDICTSWKKLTVHLAKHMEQISMPILPLVEQKQMNADTVISPVVELADKGKHSATANKSPADNPSRYIPPNPATLAPGIDPSQFAQFAPENVSGISSNVMHSYPPPQMTPQTSGYPAFAAGNSQGFTRTYPGVDHTKGKGGYMNNLQIPSQPYINGTMPNGPNRFPMTPVSAIQQQQHQQQYGGFTDSPIETAPYTMDTLRSTYNLPQEQQNMMGFDGRQRPPPQEQSAYQSMLYMRAQAQAQQRYSSQR